MSSVQPSMTATTIEDQLHQDTRLLVRLEQRARQSSAAGHLHEAAEIWAKREVVRVRRSYLLRMLWTQQGVTRLTE